MRVSIDGLTCYVILDEDSKRFDIVPTSSHNQLTFESFSISDYMSVQLCLAMLWDRVADSYTCGPWTVERV